MGSLHLAVQLWRSAFYVNVADALFLNVPVELGSEFMPVIGFDLFDPERELFDNVIDKVLSVGLIVFVIDLERADARGVIDRRILEPADFLAARSDEGEEPFDRLRTGLTSIWM